MKEAIRHTRSRGGVNRDFCPVRSNGVYGTRLVPSESAL